jgi:type I restriction enzyme M protein
VTKYIQSTSYIPNASNGETMNILQNILKDTNYGLKLFNNKEIEELIGRVFYKGQNQKAYVKCLIREKDILLKPEEIVRQLFLNKLIYQYGYPKKRIAVEHPVHFGRELKSADIVIFDKDRPNVEYIVVEVKKPKLLDGKGQLRSYCNATGAPIAVWSNGDQRSYYHRRDPNYFEDITEIPNVNQTLEDILQERYTLKDLFLCDKIPNEGKSLKTIILDMEDEVLANAGVDVFEEVFKLIFAKLYDELKSKDDKRLIMRELNKKLSNFYLRDYEKAKEALKYFDDSDFRVLEFRNTGQTESELKKKIQGLFDEAKEAWEGVFTTESKIELTPSHLAICVSSLQDVKLFNSNLQVIDEAFEYLVNKTSKGEKGQYFTPRYVIDMCVKMLNPKKNEYIIDPAAGSCGFTVHAMFYLWGHLFFSETALQDKEDALRVFGIDFDEKAVRVARTLNLIAGDGESNVLHLNSLDYERWEETTTNSQWLSTYSKGYKRLLAFRESKKSNKNFLFDIVMTNPPFAGDIKESRIIHKYDLGYNEKRKPYSKVGRDILFIERCLDLLRPGGRASIILPQGRFNNTTDSYIRKYISERARILAIVGLNVNTFKPHTGTKTSILFMQKWNDDLNKGPLCLPKDDYPIFFAVSEKSGKDNSGEYIYLINGDGKPALDKYGHLIIDHDLHNQDGERPDGIAEAFIFWATEEGLSFWNGDNE